MPGEQKENNLVNVYPTPTRMQVHTQTVVCCGCDYVRKIHFDLLTDRPVDYSTAARCFYTHDHLEHEEIFFTPTKSP